ncbi:hypothetical protein NG798_19680 [Ancylothrix sp. C2]|uniref:hypothetical protein n=1 Tax=Ancylothrix sp. D3o TaxID=2953691 RepID=UPI0021BABF50|nr:hypothetical protein [Ancylothrix sp. D3o]MCT7952023.1 hypothetical protein [Ancylothrix sp. D3o]
MKPIIKDQLAWEQANVLMQPALIRVIDNIRKHLDESVWQGSYQEVQNPYPGYQLCLQNKEHQITLEIWDLCYQVCFSNYQPTHAPEETFEVEIDHQLLEEETGEVDWNRLDSKAKKVVDKIFAELPVV